MTGLKQELEIAKREDEIEGVPIHRTAYFYPYFGLRKSARLQLDLKGGNLCSFALMHRLASHRDVNLVHLHTRKRLGGMVRTVARLRGVPYVLHLHGGIIFLKPIVGTAAAYSPRSSTCSGWSAVSPTTSSASQAPCTICRGST